MKKEMLINVLQPEETRIAILENDVLEELYVERVSNEGYVGNIYKGRVVNIEPSIQAVFIDFGVGRNGFLHISDVDPIYFEGGGGLDRLISPPPEDRTSRSEGGRGEGGRGRSERRREPPPHRGEPRPSPSFEDDDLTDPFDISLNREPDDEPIDEVLYGEAPAEAEVDEEPPRERRPRSESERRERRGPAEGRERPDRDRGRRGRRGRGGRSRREPRVANDIPSELLTPSESLPDLDELQLEDIEPTERARSAREDVDAEPAVEAAAPAWPDLFANEPPKAPAAATGAKPEEEEDEFGAGILDDLEDPPAEAAQADAAASEPSAGDDTHDDEPGIERAPGVYRRTNEDEDDGFGRGILDDDLDEPAPRHREEPAPRIEGPPPVLETELAADDTPMTAQTREGGEGERGGRSRRRRRGGRNRGRGERGERPDRPAEKPEESRERFADLEEEELQPESLRDRRSGREVSAPLDDDLFISQRDEDDRDDEHFAAAEPVVAERPRSTREPRDRDRGRHRDQGRNGDRRRQRPNGGRLPPRGGSARRPRNRPPIQEIFRRGQEVLVQVIKEGIGNKGPTLSTYISIPGRYLVLMPGLNRVGVSRKIVDEEQRRSLRQLLLELDRPNGVGFIIRTAGLERTKKELERDLAYLTRLWEVVVRRIKNQRGPAVIYQESDMIIRTIRDIFTGEIDTIYIDEPTAYERAKEFLQIVMPKYVNRLKLYDRAEPLFHHFGIEEEISRIQKRTVPLPHGGSIVIDQTEALVAIDVNSGNFRADDNAEETAYQINLSAAREIARQLRLRDLGGVIVNDFIDMREERHRRAVEQELREAVKRDRARTKILRMSAFGMIEMTRQRIRPSLKRSLYRECAACQGTGQVKTVETISIECMRMLTFAGQCEGVARIQLTVDTEVATFLQNHKRKELATIEDRTKIVISILGKDTRFPEAYELECFNAQGERVEVEQLLGGR